MFTYILFTKFTCPYCLYVFFLTKTTLKKIGKIYSLIFYDNHGLIFCFCRNVYKPCILEDVKEVRQLSSDEGDTEIQGWEFLNNTVSHYEQYTVCYIKPY